MVVKMKKGGRIMFTILNCAYAAWAIATVGQYLLYFM